MSREKTPRPKTGASTPKSNKGLVVILALLGVGIVCAGLFVVGALVYRLVSQEASEAPPAATLEPTPTSTPAVLYLPETGGDSPAAGTAAGWVIAAALVALALGLAWRPKRSR